MQPDKLTDIEELAYYRKYHKSRTTAIILFSILFFILGFIAARIIYVDLPHAFRQPVTNTKQLVLEERETVVTTALWTDNARFFSSPHDHMITSQKKKRKKRKPFDQTAGGSRSGSNRINGEHQRGSFVFMPEFSDRLQFGFPQPSTFAGLFCDALVVYLSAAFGNS